MLSVHYIILDMHWRITNVDYTFVHFECYFSCEINTKMTSLFTFRDWSICTNETTRVCVCVYLFVQQVCHNNNNNMFISYSWYNNEMVQIQMENMPKNYNTHASYKSSTQSDEGTYSLVLQTICIFDITVQQYLITRNFPNQIRQFGWIKYWQVITIVFTCSELFYRSYSITCFNINSAGSVFAQIIIGAIP